MFARAGSTALPVTVETDATSERSKRNRQSPDCPLYQPVGRQDPDGVHHGMFHPQVCGRIPRHAGHASQQGQDQEGSKDEQQLPQLHADVEEQQLRDLVELEISSDEDDLLENALEMEVSSTVEAEDAPVIRFVDLMLSQAIKSRASDIHIEPRREQGNVRFRIDGVMHQVYEIPANITAAVVSRIKIMGRLDVAEKRKPQDGRIKTLSPNGAEIELQRIGEDGIGGVVATEHALSTRIDLHQRYLILLTARGAKIGERLVIDGEETTGGPVFGCHVGNCGPIR